MQALSPHGNRSSGDALDTLARSGASPRPASNVKNIYNVLRRYTALSTASGMFDRSKADLGTVKARVAVHARQEQGGRMLRNHDRPERLEAKFAWSSPWATALTAGRADSPSSGAR